MAEPAQPPPSTFGKPIDDGTTESPEVEEPASSKYQLNSFEDFRQYCIDANVALVRPKFLEELCRAGGVWPRRQEAEKMEGALYKPGPDDQFSFIGISHCWEAREHPDPFGFQLRTIVDALHYWKAANPEKYEDGDTYFFIDYMSLPQFLRNAEEEKDFQLAMQHMHFFYANSGADFCKSVWRLERLTPRSLKRWQLWQGRSIAVYSLAEGRVAEVPLKRLKSMVNGKCCSTCDDKCCNLHINDVMYLCRGWCRAEFEWAKPNTVDISRQATFLRCCWATYDAEFIRLSLPWTPEAFQQQLASEQLKFTHRSDMGPVVKLQELVFHQKVATMEEFQCNWLRLSEVEDLVKLLPRLQAVETFALMAAYLSSQQQVPLAKALAFHPTLRKVEIAHVQLTIPAVELLVSAPRLHRLEMLRLDACGLGDAGAKVVADAFVIHPALTELHLAFNGIGSAGAVALAHALPAIRCLEELNVRWNRIHSLGAVALANAANTLKRLDIRDNPIGAKGARALRCRSIDVESEVLHFNVDTSWLGFFRCILWQLFMRLFLSMVVLPMTCFRWRQRMFHVMTAKDGSRVRPAEPSESSEEVIQSGEANAAHRCQSDNASVATID
ncbi:LRR and CARD domains-containing protein 3) (Nucleotide-binding oligomerization domain protein 3) [Durusdinium trenchii]